MMKKLFLKIAGIAMVITLLHACKIDKPDFTDPNAFKTANGSGSGTSSGSGSLSDSWHPLSQGSYWKYASTGLVNDTVTFLMTGTTSTINGKVYYNATTSSAHYKASTASYFYTANHIYSMKETALTGNLTVELLYLNDTTAINHTWTAPVTDNGTINDVPARLVGTVLEKDISRTLYHKTFSNVVHTQLSLEYDFGTGFSQWALYDVYVAKGIGIIEIDSNISGLTSTEVLYDYSIK